MGALGQHEAAARSLKRAVALLPSDAAAHANLALALLRVHGNAPEAPSPLPSPHGDDTAAAASPYAAMREDDGEDVDAATAAPRVPDALDHIASLFGIVSLTEGAGGSGVTHRQAAASLAREAVESARAAAALSPGLFAANLALGCALHAARSLPDMNNAERTMAAVDGLDRACAGGPADGDVRVRLGDALLARHATEMEAIRVVKAAPAPHRSQHCLTQGCHSSPLMVQKNNFCVRCNNSRGVQIVRDTDAPAGPARGGGGPRAESNTDAAREGACALFVAGTALLPPAPP